MTTALLLEDEPLLRAGLRDALARLWPDLRIVCETGDGDEALAYMLRERPDVAFLDIQVPGSSGLDIARQFSGRVHIVFVTAHTEHAVEAFERGAVDYLLKPLQTLRLASTIERLHGRLADGPRPVPPEVLQSARAAGAAEPAPPADAGAADGSLRWLQATVGTQTKLIPLREVMYMRSDTKYTRIVRQRDEVLVRRSLADLLQVVDPKQFWQIHRSTLVNMEYVDAVVRDAFGGMELVLRGRDERLAVSRAHRALFKGM
jgi:DNA-binding LytR/AlgR family response regulator